MDNSLKFECTHCGYSQIVGPEYAGKQVKCPKCQTVCLIGYPPAKAQFVCKYCGYKRDIDPKYIGVVCPCTKCGKNGEIVRVLTDPIVRQNAKHIATIGLRDIPLQPDSEDKLGFGKYADALALFAKQCETPMTIALQGDWGSGKTSLMNLIQGNMSDSDKYTTIWFNTWQYSQFGLEEQLPISLITHFLEKLPKSEDEGVSIKLIKNTLFKTIKFTKTVALLTLDNVTDMKISKAFQSDKDGKKDADPIKEIDKLKNTLQNIVNRYINENSEKRIIVFIDDLDRLEPIRAVELLEAFKLFLDIHGCVFFLACDYKVVIQGLQQKFGADIADTNEKNFFDKIIQLPFKMPTAQYDVKSYIEALLKNIRVEYSEKDLKIYHNLIEHSVGFNPRGLKRVFNCLLLLIKVAEMDNMVDSDNIATKSEKEKLLFATICLQNSFEEFHSFLTKKIKQKLSGRYFDDITSNDDNVKKNNILNDVNYVYQKNEYLRNKCAKFVIPLKEAMQLTSDANDLQTSQEEVDTFIKILTLSSITSVSYPSETVGEEFENDPCTIFMRKIYYDFTQSCNDFGKYDDSKYAYGNALQGKRIFDICNKDETFNLYIIWGGQKGKGAQILTFEIAYQDHEKSKTFKKQMKDAAEKPSLDDVKYECSFGDDWVYWYLVWKDKIKYNEFVDIDAFTYSNTFISMYSDFKKVLTFL